MRNFWIFFVLMVHITPGLKAQRTLSLEDCRSLAIENNKQLKISGENIQKAEEEKKAAFTNYLPDISFTGAYLRNQKNLHLLGEDIQLDPIPGLLPNGLTIPKERIKNGLEVDIHNIYVGSFMLMQPVYMGGKIRAYNQITDYMKELAQSMDATSAEDVILQTDQAYWQTVSLVNKKKLAENYAALLRQMDRDVQLMIDEGFATRADGLTVRVKLNEAEMQQTQVDNGLGLTRMLLCQLCGLPVGEPVALADEKVDVIPTENEYPAGDVSEAWANRSELKSLELATRIYEKKEIVVRSEMLPTLALAGTYMISNPNSYNGLKKDFAGAWHVGLVLKVPIFHWGERFHNLNAAKADTRIKRLELDDAREKIELQVNQSNFKVTEAQKRVIAATKNKESAEENLRYANLGFKEGVIPASDVLSAQTAWVKAHSDLIDAQISLRLGQTELQKALGKIVR
ncbi:MAG: TolC family protein [Tannerella sp.]|jgi:outer membrane protein TolC|nr:TolC family protein [Tannerella sp.]